MDGFRTGAGVQIITTTETVFGEGPAAIVDGVGIVQVLSFSPEQVVLNLSDSTSGLVPRGAESVEFFAGNLNLCNLRAVVYTVDSTVPTLLHYATDLDAGTLTMSFSETVDKSTFNATEIVVHATDGDIVAERHDYALQFPGTLENGGTDATGL